MNTVLELTSPSELSYWSRPSAVYAREPPAVMVADAGDKTRWSSEPAVTLNDAVAVFPSAVPVTVCAPAEVAVQLAPVQDPFGPIEKVVLDVTSPSGLPDTSNPCATYVWEAPAKIDALEGLTTM